MYIQLLCRKFGAIDSKVKYPLLENCNPSSCISMRMTKCNRIIAGIFRKHLGPLGITNSQMSMLFIITKSGGASQKQLSDVLYLEKSTVNRNILRLLQQKYIAQKYNKHLFATARGKRFLEKIIPYWDNAMAEANAVLGAAGLEALSLMHNNLTE